MLELVLLLTSSVITNNTTPDFSLQNLASPTGQADWPVVPWLSFTAILKYWNDDSLFPFLWYFASIQ